MSLLPVAEAQARLIALADPLPAETAPLASCAGRWLAEDLHARRSQPWADLSAMDGYAIRHADLPGPWRVIGESAAGGGAPPPVTAGQAVRIFTGAPLPAGADSIIIQEDVQREGDRLRLTGDGAARPGRHVRKAGSDFWQGERLLPAGARLAAPALALAALGGHGALPVRRAARVAILSTGNELVPPGADVPPGKLPSSNAVMLAAMLHDLPCVVDDIGIVGDDLASLTDAFERARSADVIVSTGGASVGDHDLVRPAFAAVGGSLDFWKIRMRPGKPLIAGTLGRSLFLGLPGNPVSAFVTGTLFLLPLIRHLAGAREPWPRMRTAYAGEAMPPGGERDEYARGTLEGDRVVGAGAQDSAALLALAGSDALILRPAGCPAAQAGDPVDILPLSAA